MTHGEGNRRGTAREQTVLFSESQGFTQWWVWLIVLGIAGLNWWGFVEQILLSRPFGDNPAPDWMLLLFTALFGIGLPWLMAACKLRTTVTADGIIVQFTPFHLKPRIIPLDGIREFAARHYNAILEFGGWGVRLGRGGQALNVSGGEGVQLVFVNGQRLLIGSQRAGQFAAALEQAVSLAQGR